MKKIAKQLLFILSLTLILVLPYFVFAQTDSGPLGKLQEVGSGANGPFATSSVTGISSIVGTVINVALSLLGVVFVILVVVAGYQWMMAGGNEEQVKKAQAHIKTAIIGLVITISAYVMWAFVSGYLL